MNKKVLTAIGLSLALLDSGYRPTESYSGAEGQAPADYRG